MLVIGIAGKELTAEERDWLQHPGCAGRHPVHAQLRLEGAGRRAVAGDPRRRAAPAAAVRGPGRRARAAFPRRLRALPPLENFGRLYASERDAALRLAEEHAWLMASEIRATGIDLSFRAGGGPGRGNRAIGNRAFHAEPDIVADFTRAYVRGMHSAGHGGDAQALPGPRLGARGHALRRGGGSRARWNSCWAKTSSLRRRHRAGAEAVMMAHVTYPAVAPEPAGYSPRWMNEILRRDMGFRGVVFSDDIGMAAAEGVGGIKARIDAHLDAGCDVVLVCPPALVAESLRAMDSRPGRQYRHAGLAARARSPRLGRLARGSALR
jgi:beta-N-acetylhexosaminidase